ncbi:DUF6018 family natural product bioysynthesis protein [Cytobacillus pseudoceanisediminis]|uniref:DUF6018 family natural product bioysynthesis protein n=1 Tax=Cytobacillus TaxID=2675230 RepID=UPI0020C922FD|nr:DUF6018 family natural product bioysynthesis protein [Cytobacillus oceanisediminis]
MAVTMSQLLGIPGDVIEDCRKEIRLLPLNDRYCISAEILLRNGERRYFRAKSIDKKSATQEVLLFPPGSLNRVENGKETNRTPTDARGYIKDNGTNFVAGGST